MLQRAQVLSIHLVEALYRTVTSNIGPGFKPLRSKIGSKSLHYSLACLRVVKHEVLTSALLVRLVGILGMHGQQTPWVREAWEFLTLRGHLSQVSCLWEGSR